jgi:hypothetical protein
MNVDHERFADWDSAYVLGALSPAERREYEGHLESCERCRRAVEELAPMPGLLARLTPERAEALLGDGDGDGVRTQDIDDGVDAQVEPWRPLTHLGRGIGFGFPPGPLPRDPTSGRPIGGSRDDAIRFNSSDLASFSAAGTATPGSVYLTDGRRGFVVVRVTNVSGRVRTLRWDHDDALWRAI